MDRETQLLRNLLLQQAGEWQTLANNAVLDEIPVGSDWVAKALHRFKCIQADCLNRARNEVLSRVRIIEDEAILAGEEVPE